MAGRSRWRCNGWIARCLSSTHRSARSTLYFRALVDTEQTGAFAVRPVLSALSSNVVLAVLAGIMGFGPIAATAAERYVEVWNPPEAQTHKAKGKTRSVLPVQAKKKRKSGPTVKQVADKTTAAPPALSAGPSTGRPEGAPQAARATTPFPAARPAQGTGGR